MNYHIAITLPQIFILLFNYLVKNRTFSSQEGCDKLTSNKLQIISQLKSAVSNITFNVINGCHGQP